MSGPSLLSDLVPIRSVFMRGGASKALVFHRADLPADHGSWDRIFLAAMGSPDPHGRQLDGMGGGISSLSKVCVIGPSSRPDADIDYTFGQVEIGAARVDYAGNCGSMSAAVGPFAVDEKLVLAPPDGEAVVRIHNTNTGRIIRARFQVRGGRAAVSGDLAIDGIAGAGAPVRLDFLEPGGANTGQLLPTARPLDRIDVPGLGPVEYSFVDASNPVMFVEAAALGLRGDELPPDIEAADGLLERIDLCRRMVTVAYGAAPDLEAARQVSLPRIALLAGPRDSLTLSGRRLAAEELDILVRMIARGLPNRTVPVTTAVCLAIACRVPGTIAHRLTGGRARRYIRIAHPSGVWRVEADVALTSDGSIAVESASVQQTARRLFQGEVLVPASIFRP